MLFYIYKRRIRRRQCQEEREVAELIKTECINMFASRHETTHGPRHVPVTAQPPHYPPAAAGLPLCDLAGPLPAPTPPPPRQRGYSCQRTWRNFAMSGVGPY